MKNIFKIFAALVVGFALFNVAYASNVSAKDSAFAVYNYTGYYNPSYLEPLDITYSYYPYGPSNRSTQISNIEGAYASFPITQGNSYVIVTVTGDWSQIPYAQGNFYSGSYGVYRMSAATHSFVKIK